MALREQFKFDKETYTYRHFFRKQSIKVQDIRNTETQELLNKVEEYKKELFGLRFQHATGQLEDTARMKKVKKNIARIKTVIRERELDK